MSAYTIVKTKLVSKEHIVKALNDVGFSNIEVYDKPQQLVGWLGDTRPQSCEIIIRKKYISGASNDIGFSLNKNGTYDLVISDFDRALPSNRSWVSGLAQRYAYHVAMDSLPQQGFELANEEVGQDKTIRLTLRRMA